MDTLALIFQEYDTINPSGCSKISLFAPLTMYYLVERRLAIISWQDRSSSTAVRQAMI